MSHLYEAKNGESADQDPRGDNRYGHRKEFDQWWSGSTRFEILRPTPPKGKQWVNGRLTKIQKSRRPAHIWPEVWIMMSRSERRNAIKEWEIKHPNYVESENLLMEWHAMVKEVMGGIDQGSKQKNSEIIKKEIGATVKITNEQLNK